MDLSIRDVLTTWRDLERQLDELVTDDERAAEISSRIAVLRDAYRHMVETPERSHIALPGGDTTVERARAVLRQHFLASWSAREAGIASPEVWRRVIDRLLREHVAEGARCRSCGRLPEGMTPFGHQALVIHDRLVQAGAVRVGRHGLGRT
jgi:hypothetical protein